MELQPVFYESVIGALDDHITVLNEQGDIVYVNNAWIKFAQDNRCSTTSDWQGHNYFRVCEEAVNSGDEFAINATEGLSRVISGDLDTYYFEYPCHAPDEQRFFMMRLNRFIHDDQVFVLSVHKNITERVIAEQKVLALSRVDGLTKIANRRSFESFYREEWGRCAREKIPISVAMLDVDYFKLINDHYGHLYGDECLKIIAVCLKQSLKRPRDFCARYGGEEFAIVMGNVSSQQAYSLVERIRLSIENEKMGHELSPIGDYVTASFGLATVVPSYNVEPSSLIQQADEALYQAKSQGRNRACIWTYNDSVPSWENVQ